jgi:thiamine-monophosphate kinase
VAAAGEHQLIALIRRLVPPPPAWVSLGIGDDAAVVEPPRNRLEVITTDVQIEHVHFDRTFVDPASIGYRALAVNLSDLAAMGAAPRLAVLSLGLPAAMLVEDVEQMVRALVELATAHNLPLVGGNIARSPGPLFIDVTLTGEVKRRRVLTRAGGRPGDVLYVTGALGAAAAGLAWLRAAGADAFARTAALPDGPVRDAVTRFLRPEPRLRFGTIAGRTGAASACMDLSDGLGDAVRQLAQASGTGAIVEANALPIHPAATEILTGSSDDRLRAALSAGEDYELLLAVPRRRHRRFLAVQRLTKLAVTRIGQLTVEPEIVLRRAAEGDGPGVDEPLPGGFEHFA